MFSTFGKKPLIRCLLFFLLFGGCLYGQSYAFLTWTVEDGLPQNGITALAQDSLGYLYVRTDNGQVSRFDGAAFTAASANVPLQTEDRLTLPDGTSWVARPGRGLYHLSRKESTLGHYTAENSELPTNEVRALLWDRQRRIWVGTSRGLVRLIPTGLRQYDRDDGLRETDVTAVYATPGGTLWFGHPDGRVGCLDSSGVSYPPRDAYAGRICAITSMGQDTNQLVFCASDSGITVYDDSLRIERLTQRSSLPTGPVINLLAARDTPAVWIVCRDGIARVTDRDTLLHVENFALPEGEVTAVARHPAGGLLLATTVSSVFHWRADTILAGMATYSPEGFIALAVRRGSQLWALRESEGLFYTDLRMRVPAFAPVGTHRGFDSRETVHLLVPPDKPELWLGTEKELIRLFLDRNGQPDWVKRYGRGEGYPGGRVQASAIDEQGTIWFGTTRGLVRYGGDNPNRFLDPPPTHLAAINVFYTPVDSVAYERWDGKPRFTPQDNHFHFRFRAVDLTYPERVRYHYRLRGEQTEWSPLTAETSVRYAGLTPGSYAFAVQATTDGGNTWGEPATYSFTIARPLIKEGWFLTLLTLVGIGLLVSIFYAFYRRVERREAARRVALEARNQRLELEQKALQLQMNPHFIFNALNGIRGLVDGNHDAEARDQISRFAGLMRGILNNSRRESIPLADELKTLGDYLRMEQFCQPFSFTFTLHPPPGQDAEEISLPPMLLQPFVENAVLHGLSGKEGGGHIDVTFSVRGRRMQCEVIDNGIGRKAAAQRRKARAPGHKSVALDVTRARLAAIGGKLRIDDRPEGGTIVILTVPVESW